jgi:hypothetical protein
MALLQTGEDGDMQVIATGKWSKVLKRFQMVVAIRRPTATDGSSARRQPGRGTPRPKGAS